MSLSFYPASVPSQLSDLPAGVDGIKATLKQMVRFARQYKKDPGIMTLARQLCDHLPDKDYGAEMTCLQHFVRDQIRYVRDIHEVETLQTPIRTLEIRSGDCDDKSTLLAALLASVGFPTRFVAVGFKDGPYSHVLAEAQLGTRWIPLETIVAGREPGWFPEGVTRQMLAHV